MSAATGEDRFRGNRFGTLDAIHLASALLGRKAIPDLAMLSLDTRVRRAAHRLGFPLVPGDAEPGS